MFLNEINLKMCSRLLFAVTLISHEQKLNNTVVHQISGLSYWRIGTNSATGKINCFAPSNVITKKLQFLLTKHY